jgi:hypothetical protein
MWRGYGMDDIQHVCVRVSCRKSTEHSYAPTPVPLHTHIVTFMQYGVPTPFNFTHPRRRSIETNYWLVT